MVAHVADAPARLAADRSESPLKTNLLESDLSRGHHVRHGRFRICRLGRRHDVPSQRYHGSHGGGALVARWDVTLVREPSCEKISSAEIPEFDRAGMGSRVPDEATSRYELRVSVPRE